jgi:DNA-binding HxlR family transcriptional regulator
LEERGLIERNYYSQEGQGTCTTYVALTESGIDLSNRLTK